MPRTRTLLATFALAATLISPVRAQDAAHALAMHGKPKYPAGFTHFSHVNPEAPKGGRVVLGQTGSFDTLNPLIIRGEAAVGVRDWVYETLMARSMDEPFTMY